MTLPSNTKEVQLLAVTSGQALENRLFFAARNLAIEAMLLRLTTRLLRQGFAAECHWAESSFGSPRISLRMLNPKPKEDSWEYGECVLTLKREPVPGAPAHLSSLVYRVDAFSANEYWHGKQPAKLLRFREFVQALYEDDELAAEVAKVNYPFDYKSFSPF